MRSQVVRSNAFWQSFEKPSGGFRGDRKAVGGIAAALVGIVAVELILNIMPLIIIPMQMASSSQISGYGNANWTAAYASVTTSNLNAYTMMATIPQVQTVILILAVVLAVA
jgi:hypothetical protein